MKKYSLIMILVFFPASMYSDTYYVDNNAAPGGNGSYANPWQEIQTGLNNLNAGDTLFIRGDIADERIYEQTSSLSFPASGTVAAAIVVKAYKGEKVAVTMTGTTSLCVFDNDDFWVIEDVRFEQNGVASDCIRIRNGSKGVTFRRCIVRNGTRDGFDISHGDSILIDSCTLFNFYVAGLDAHGIVLEDGVGNIFTNNEIYDCSGDCIQIISGNSSETLIEGNHLHIEYQTNCENAVDVKSTAGLTVIRNNICYGFQDSDDSDGTAIIVHGFSPQTLIEENIICDCDGGIRVNKTSYGTPTDVTIQKNLMYHIGFETSTGRRDGIYVDGAQDINVYNNTVHDVNRYALYCSEDDSVINMLVHNNIFSDANRVRYRNYYGSVAVSHNGYFNISYSLPAETSFCVVGNDPGFADPINGDFSLLSTSVCIDTGIDVGLPFAGTAPDLGAFEYMPPGIEDFKRPHTPTINFSVTPNPFTEKVTISYQTCATEHANLKIFNAVGKLIKSFKLPFSHGSLPPSIMWDGRDNHNRHVHSGVYFCVLCIDRASVTRKVVFVR